MIDRGTIIKLAREAGIEWQGGFVRVAECVTQPELERFAALVAAAERKDLADVVAKCDPRATPKGIAAAIRARSQQ